MPGNTSNFNNHHEVAYSFCLDSYIFNANICIEQKSLVGHFPNSELSFFTNNASFGHFHQVSMNSITNCTFSNFRYNSRTITNEEKVTTRGNSH